MTTFSLKQWKLAISFNAFVFPGAGYFFLKQKIKGVVVISIVLLLFVIAVRAYTNAFESALQQTMQADQLSLASLVRSLTTAWQLSAKPIVLALVGILVVWIGSIVDIYRLKDRAAASDVKGQA